MIEPWRLKKLGRVATLQRGFDLPHRLRRQGAVPIVTSSGIEDLHDESRVRAPGVVTGRYGTIGKVFLVTEDFWPLNTTLFVKDFHHNDARFVAYLLRTIDFDTHSGKSGVPGVNRNDLHELEVAVPPTRAEQEAIAEALSDADALIESLEQLLAKKRQIKQGAMQELLTGKKRLAGFGPGRMKNTEIGMFPSDWEAVQIGDVFSVKTGPFGSSLHQRDYVEDGTPIITVEHLGEQGVVHSNLPKVSADDRKRLSAYSLALGDIVFSRVGSVDRNALISCNEDGWLFSGRLLRLRPISRRVVSAFTSFQFHTEPFKARVRTVAVGQTMASLNTRIVKELRIVLPDAQEQFAIAAVLSEMDAAVSSLESKLLKARQVKQGMMQQLLTGRIRLV